MVRRQTQPHGAEQVQAVSLHRPRAPVPQTFPHGLPEMGRRSQEGRAKGQGTAQVPRLRPHGPIFLPPRRQPGVGVGG